MIVNVLLTLLWLSGAVYVFAMLRAARAKGQLSLDLESIGLGAVTNFFDTLGIGSFAPTTAHLKLRKMVPDSFIPSTLNAGHCIPTIVEALHQARQRRPHSADSLYRVGHYRCGLRIRRRHSPAHPDRARRCRRGSCIASGLYALQNLNLMPRGRKRVIAGAIMDRRRGGRARRAWRAHDVRHRPLCAITHHAEPDGPRSEGRLSHHDGRVCLPHAGSRRHPRRADRGLCRE
jgi:hypothetical protein